MDSAVDYAILTTDLDGRITDWNRGAENLLGWAAGEIIGQSAGCIFTPEDRASGVPEREMRNARESGRGSDERWHLRKDGSRFFGLGEMMPLDDEQGQLVGYLKILRDRTRERLRATRLALLSQASASLLTATDPEVVLEPILSAGAGALGFDQSVIYDVTPDGGHLTLIASVGIDEPDKAALAFVPFSMPLCGIVAQTGRPLVLEGLQADVTPRYAIAREAGVDAYAGYPIVIEDRVESVISFASCDHAAFDNEALSFFATIARFLTVVRERTVAERVLRASESKWRGLFENLQEGFVLGRVVRDESGRVVDWRYEEVNRAWGDLVGVDPATVVGRTLREVVPGVDDARVSEFADVVETGQATRFTQQVAALARWYDGVAQPSGDDRFTVIFMDVTARVLQQRRRDILLTLGDRLHDLSEADDISAVASEALAQALDCGIVGYGDVDPAAETIGIRKDWTAPGVAGLAGTLALADFGTFAADLKRGEVVIVRDGETDPRTRNLAGDARSRHARAFVVMPVFERGRFVAVLYVGAAEPRDWTTEELAFVRDVADRVRIATERARGERALRESDERQRLAIDVGEVGVWEFRLATRELRLDARMRAMNGVFGGELDTARALAAVHPNDRSRLDRALQRLASGEIDTLAIQFRVVGIEDGIVRSILINGLADRDAKGTAIRLLGAARDVTDRVAADERRAVLNRELAHRLKNTLAIVQSIATQTLRTAPDMVAARKSLTDRIGALAKAHDILLEGRRDAGSLHAIVQTATALHDGGGRVRLHGPSVEIGPKAALTLSLIVHELATNAGKYGALSVENGHVDVMWSVTPDADTNRPNLAFEWRETGGPPVTAPERRSFGTRLIEMGLSGSAAGTSEIDYAPGGLVCRIAASLTELQTEDESEA